MKRILRLIALGALVAGLAACGPPKKSVFPPTVTIQEMKVRPDGQWQLTVRIQNNSYGSMDFHSIDGELKVADGIPVRIHASFDLDIPAFAGDVTQVNVLPTADMTAAIKVLAAKGSSGSLAYTVAGRANAKPEQEKDSRDFAFHGNDWFSPVPGIPNTYR
jgi:predicted small lipoprotein YifL